MNFKTISKTIGITLCLEGAFMLPCLVLALFDGDAPEVRGFLIAIAAVLICGLPFVAQRQSARSLGVRDGLVTAALAWLTISVFGAIPFFASGVIPEISDAVFETISGFSTTGTTVIADVEAVSRSILLWRSITHWIGGMGVLIFLMAVAPVARESGSMHLLRAEFPGPMAGKLVPRMQRSAVLLYEMYIVLTVIQTVLLCIGKVPLFDSVNISMSTVSTGGFAVKNDSLMSYSRYVQIVTMVFMFICSVSFKIFYCIFIGEFVRIRKNRELLCYALVVAVATVFIMLDSVRLFDSFGDNLHHSLYQVISLISTTGHLTCNESIWSPFVWSVLAVLMITGPMAGSTGGGMKLSRVMILFKSCYRSILRATTPGTVHLIHLDGEIVDEDTVSTVNSFVVMYFFAMIISSVLLSLNGLSLSDGLLIGISCLSNIGLGIDNNVLQMGNSFMAILSKATLCFNMFLGRLEFFPLLVLFTPATWKK